MSETLATPRQIRKLFATLRNSGVEPKEYVKKLKEETGLNSLNEFTRKQISRQIDLFENCNEKTEVVEEENGKTEVVEAFEEEKGNNKVLEELGVDKVRLNEIDVVLSECLDRVTKIVSSTLAKTEPTQAIVILELTKLYLNEVRKGAERG